MTGRFDPPTPQLPKLPQMPNMPQGPPLGPGPRRPFGLTPQIFVGLAFIGPDSTKALLNVIAAGAQGKLFDLADALYANQGEENSGYVTDDFLRQIAAASGVNASAAFAQTKSTSAQDFLARAHADAAKLGINATPTFTVARGSGPARVVGSGVLDRQTMAAAIDKQLAR